LWLCKHVSQLVFRADISYIDLAGLLLITNEKVFYFDVFSLLVMLWISDKTY
jgi:hypothetical protein